MIFKNVKRFAHTGNPMLRRTKIHPRPRAEHNIQSWAKLSAKLGDDTMSLEKLTVAVGVHGGPVPVPPFGAVLHYLQIVRCWPNREAHRVRLSVSLRESCRLVKKFQSRLLTRSNHSELEKHVHRQFPLD